LNTAHNLITLAVYNPKPVKIIGYCIAYLHTPRIEGWIIGIPIPLAPFESPETMLDVGDISPWSDGHQPSSTGDQQPLTQCRIYIDPYTFSYTNIYIYIIYIYIHDT